MIMKNIKLTVTGLLSMVVTLSISACGGNNDTASSNGNGSIDDIPFGFYGYDYCKHSSVICDIPKNFKDDNWHHPTPFSYGQDKIYSL
jgi:hypothetical protein